MKANHFCLGVGLVEQLVKDVGGSDLRISKIQYTPINPQGSLIGFLSFVYDDAFFFSNVAIHTKLNSSGLRLVFPNRKLSNGSSAQVFHPINQQAYELVLNQLYQHLDKIGVLKKFVNQEVKHAKGSTSGVG